MIRVVLDTNVLVSALITKKSSPPLQIYKAFVTQQFLLITSPAILIEVEDVINRKNIVNYHKLAPSQRRRIIKQLTILSYITLETVPLGKTVIENDPEDDKFLQAALAGEADYIISGDSHLLDVREFEGIKILSPNEFLGVLKKAKIK